MKHKCLTEIVATAVLLVAMTGLGFADLQEKKLIYYNSE